MPIHINIVTLFPEWFETTLKIGVIGKAIESGIVQVECINPRNFALDRHRTVDDRPYGGGPGMVMMVEPLDRALESVSKKPQGSGRMLMLSASGNPIQQNKVQEFAKEEVLTFICGRYEGIDTRIAQMYPIEHVSVGDIVVSGGESAATMLIEATVRLIPGVMGKEASAQEESFAEGLLEYPHYTRPEVFNGNAVPKVLLSGDHKKIEKWRREQSLQKTLHTRPEMLDKAILSQTDIEFFTKDSDDSGCKKKSLGKNLHCALVHYPVLLGDRSIGTSSLTNLDVHDIARCIKTYDIESFTVVTPLHDQQKIVKTIVEHWTKGPGSVRNQDRAEALNMVSVSSSVEEVVNGIKSTTGQEVVVVGTSACSNGGMLPYTVKGMLEEGVQVLLLFGTGHGIAPRLLEQCKGVLRPLRWMSKYNHLSVRSAVAITIDRILGDIS